MTITIPVTQLVSMLHNPYCHVAGLILGVIIFFCSRNGKLHRATLCLLPVLFIFTITETLSRQASQLETDYQRMVVRSNWAPVYRAMRSVDDTYFRAEILHCALLHRKDAISIQEIELFRRLLAETCLLGECGGDFAIVWGRSDWGLEQQLRGRLAETLVLEK